MKKISIIFLFLLLIMPTFVYAVDSCDNKNVFIKMIELKKTNGLTEELSDVELEDNTINLDVKMYEVGDSIEYSLIIKNDSKDDYIVEDEYTNEDSNIEYSLKAKNGSYKIKKGTEEEFVLKATYKNKVEKEQFRSGKFDASSTVLLKVEEAKLIPFDINPKTGNIFYLLISLMLGVSIIFLFKIKNKKVQTLVLSIFMLLPVSVLADCSYNIELNSNIIIGYVKPNNCTYDGELVQGAEYTNGQYTYRYMQEGGYGSSWNNITDEGWGVKISNYSSTDDITTSLCSYINDKPVVSMAYMFFSTQAENIDLSSFYTSNVKSMESMFEYAKVQELDFSSFDTTNVNNMNYMFYGTYNLNKLDLRYFDTSRLKRLRTPFYSMANLKNLNVDNWDLSNIEENLSLLNDTVAVENISAYNLKLPKNSSYVFSNGKNLKGIEGTKTWDMSEVENASYMFSNDENLESIDFDGLDITNITNMDKIFEKCNKLKIIKLSNLDFSGFDNARLAEKLSIQSLPSLEILDFSNSKFYNNLEYAFYLYETPKIKELILTNINTENVVNMNHTFYLIKYLKKLDISDLDTQNVTDFSNMISYCSNLEELELGQINTSNVESMKEMFQFDTSLKSIDISGFDTSNLKNAEYMFYGDSAIETINASGFINPNVLSFKSLFANIKSLKTLIIDDWEPPQDISAGQNSLQFNGRPNVIENIYMRNWKIPETFEYMVNRYYLQIDEVNNIDVSGWDLSNTTSIAMLFKDGYHIRHISGLETWDTSNITNMSELFKYCYVLDEVDISNFDYSKVSRMDYMFNETHELKTVKMGYFNADSLENADNMFSQANKIEEIIFKSISTPSLKTVNQMFYQLPKLKRLDLRGMDTSHVTSMFSMFSGNTGLEYLDLSTFETNDSQNMSWMFYGCSSLTTAYAKTQADADRFNASSNKADNVQFVVKN